MLTRITQEGLALVNELDQPIKSLLKKHLGRVGQQRLKELIETLELLREDNA